MGNLTPEKIQSYRSREEDLASEEVPCHFGYLVSVGGADEEEQKSSIEAFAREKRQGPSPFYRVVDQGRAWLQWAIDRDLATPAMKRPNWPQSLTWAPPTIIIAGLWRCFGSPKDALETIAHLQVRKATLVSLQEGEVTSPEVYAGLYPKLLAASLGAPLKATRKPRLKDTNGNPVDEATAAHALKLMHDLRSTMSLDDIAKAVLERTGVKLTRQAIHKRLKTTMDADKADALVLPGSPAYITHCRDNHLLG